MEREVKRVNVASRASPLARAQVAEVLTELQRFYPSLLFECQYLTSTGDLDKLTSLRDLDKTDFFTKEIDQLLLNKLCRIAIHSAKDLPDPIPSGLVIVALTRGVDSSDSLVLREGVQLHTLPAGARIGTSSIRREEAVETLKEDCIFVDLRGTVNERLARLDTGDLDGVVVAEAALIRLGLTQLNRVKLPGDTVPFQGKLAVVARADDHEIATFFSVIDARRLIGKSLCVGLSIPEQFRDRMVDLCPLIAIEPRSMQDPSIMAMSHKLSTYTHLIFTSKTAVSLFYSHFTTPQDAIIIAVGIATAAAVRRFELQASIIIAEQECAEGVIAVLEGLHLEDACILWPHAAAARTLISDHLIERKVDFDAPIFYDTYIQRPEIVPNLEDYDELIFTSPSTVDASIEVFGCNLQKKILTCMGLVTKNYLERRLG